MSELRLGQDKKYLDKRARDEGLILVLPEPDELFLDIDVPGGKADARVLNYLRESINPQGRLMVLSTLSTISKGGNTHIYMRLNEPISDLTRVILQVCLGSDRAKELFSFIQLDRVIEWPTGNCECPIALFEMGDSYERVLSWRADKTVTVTPESESF